MINYSIIIPHKNTPDLLRKCLDSIPQRDDVQIIVVDDNSDAGKVDFGHFPGMGEPHTEVYLTKEGKGAGYARNVGLEHATGKWVVFLDSDDFFHECISELMDRCVDKDADVIFFKADSINLVDGTDGHRGDEYTERVEFAIKGKKYQSVLMYSCPWGKIFSFEFLQKHGIRFNEVRYGNDIVFMAKVLSYDPYCTAYDIIAYCITVSKNAKNESKESVEVRLGQDLEAAGIIKKKVTLSNEDKYWYFFSWKNMYKINKKRAICMSYKMYKVLGMNFIYNYMLMQYLNLKKNVKRLVTR